jgi:hypothetical protein
MCAEFALLSLPLPFLHSGRAQHKSCAVTQQQSSHATGAAATDSGLATTFVSSRRQQRQQYADCQKGAQATAAQVPN